MTEKIIRNVKFTDLGSKSQILSPITALQLPTQNLGTADNPINLLVRERGIPSVAEVSLDEPRCLVILEDVSDGGWEAALVKERAGINQAVGFSMNPGLTQGKPLLTVAEYNHTSKDKWKASVYGTNFNSVGFELDNDLGYLAGITQDNYGKLSINLPMGLPFIIQVNQRSSQVQVHWPNSSGEWILAQMSLDEIQRNGLLTQIETIASSDQRMVQRLLDMIVPPTQRETFVVRSNVPDPLEGIIEGESRQERYRRFFEGVLSEIWPESPESGEYGDDLHRSRRFDRGDISGFTQFGPHNRDLTNLTPEEFEIAVDKLGPDYLRVRSIPPHILNPDTTIIPTGGSCIIETAGEHTKTDMQIGIEEGKLTLENLADFARRLSALAPTITHISGGVLGGQDALVHLVESDMWIDSLVKYGIPRDEALTIVVSAYNRINQALARRSKLINPGSTMFVVNFDELNLDRVVREWEENVGVEYDRTKRIQEVIYTYVGPKQLELLKRALAVRIDSGSFTQEEELKARRLLDATCQLRIKQVDHGRHKSMNLPKGYITGQEDLTEEERTKMTNDHVYKMGALLMRDVYLAQQKGTATALYAGFADLPAYGNKNQHESRDMGTKFTGRPGEQAFLESVEAQLATPARLHRNNVEEHLKFLGTFLQDDKVARDELIAEKTTLLAEVSPVQREEASVRKTLASLGIKIKELELNCNNQRSIIKLVSFIRNPQDQELTPLLVEAAINLKGQKTKALEKIRAKEQDKLTEADRQDLEQIPQLIAILDSIEKGETFQMETSAIESELSGTKKTAERNIANLDELIVKKAVEKEETDSKLTQLQMKLQVLLPKLNRINAIGEQMKQLGSLGLFPLSDNPFVHHAMQFLWDTDFTLFLREAVGLQQSQRAERTDIDTQLKALQAEHDEKLEAAKSNPEAVKITSERLRSEFKQKTNPLNQHKTQIRERYSSTMRNLMTQIYPKLETYLLYFYGKIDEESALVMRQTRILMN